MRDAARSVSACEAAKIALINFVIAPSEVVEPCVEGLAVEIAARQRRRRCRPLPHWHEVRLKQLQRRFRELAVRRDLPPDDVKYGRRRACLELEPVIPADG